MERWSVSDGASASAFLVDNRMPEEEGLAESSTGPQAKMGYERGIRAEEKSADMIRVQGGFLPL